jgi:hypothetical protein
MEKTHTLPNGLPLWELESIKTFKSTNNNFRGQNSLDFLKLYHWKALETWMSKMGFHGPFGYFKHKLWPKKRLGVKLPIWFLTIKSRESPWNTCVQVVCNISLESSQQSLQLCFQPPISQKSTQEVKKLWSSKMLGVPRQDDIWISPCGWSQKIL